MPSHPSPPPASESDWAAVKALWTRLEAADQDERDRVLADESLPSTIREEVRSLLIAADAVVDRFEPNALPVAEPVVSASLVGRRLGPYEIVRQVGRGGMGAVYESVRVDDSYQQRVAIKTIWRGADSDVLLQRFRSERQILAGLQHPNIAQLLDGGSTVEGTPWLAMEFVDGVPIDRYCDDHHLSLPARLDLFRQVCSAVQFAHRHLVVHRDIKPTNVFVTTDGTVKLLDFGVAKLLDDPRGEGTLTEAGLSPFTRAFAAPEQLAGGVVSTLTDVYALGVLLYLLLTGAEPGDLATTLSPDARQEVARVRGFADNDKLRRALTGELEAIVRMAMRHEPERRYVSAAALSDDVLRYLRRDRVLARPDTLSYRARAFVRRRRALVASVTTIATVLVGSLVTIAGQSRARQLEAERSERAADFMARLVAGPDASSSDPLVRVGPRGTVAQLLDSALRQVPRQFPGDARIRARLYTAIGANFTAQGRVREAVDVLDSAQQLSRQAYGVRTTEFAAASLELAIAEFRLEGPRRAEPTLREALIALEGRALDEPELHVKAMAALANVRLATGAVREADSIAKAALEYDKSRAAPVSMSRARAEATLAQTSSWLRRDPREYVQRCRRIAAFTDQMQAQVSLERLFATGCEIEGLLVLGQVAQADSLLQRVMPGFRRAYGDTSLAIAALTAKAASIAGARGDRDGQQVLAIRSWDIVSSLPDIAAEELTGYAMMRMEAAWARREWDVADSVGHLAQQRTNSQQVPVAVVFSHFYLGLTHLQQGRWSDAEQEFRQSLAALPVTHDLDSMLPRVRRSLADALTGQQRTREADSVRALVPPKQSFPDCTPGGKWLGCAVGSTKY
ncbi:MAG: serine/threonine protein kinase [Gemmatimonadaceae bacterium]|nr:serine/threonine protein kinase [Gemmatimonadaceae bacterium]